MANVQEKSELGTQPAEKIQPQSPQEGRRAGGGLDLNRATESDIAEIDMIGKKLAHAIIEQRAVTGGFQSWDDLKNVPGLDAMKIAELQRAARLNDRS
jgi:DNA uptake protein ComE-like DNA-binding protein